MALDPQHAQDAIEGLDFTAPLGTHISNGHYRFGVPVSLYHLTAIAVSRDWFEVDFADRWAPARLYWYYGDWAEWRRTMRKGK